MQITSNHNRATAILQFSSLLLTLLLVSTFAGSYLPVGSPPVSAETSLTFSAAGDYATGAESWPVIRDHGGAFHLALGDFSYTSPEGWCGEFKSFFQNVVIVSGNHDDADMGVYVQECPFPLGGTVVGEYGVNYYFDYPSSSPLIRVIMGAAGVFDDGFGFVQNAIRDAKAQGIPWTAYGSHKVCIEPTGDKSCEIGQGFFNMLLEEKVDLILQAHAHTYSRSHQLVCADEGSFTASCIVDSDGAFAKGAGTVVVIQGIGGNSIRSSGWGDPDSDYFATTKGGDGCSGNITGCPSADFGMVQYTLTTDGLSARVFFEGGETFDPWTIGNASSLPPPGTNLPWIDPAQTWFWLVVTAGVLGFLLGALVFRRRGKGQPAGHQVTRTPNGRKKKTITPDPSLT